LSSGQGAGAQTEAALRSTGEPGKASPRRRGGRILKCIRRRERGKMVAALLRTSQSAWAALKLWGSRVQWQIVLLELRDPQCGANNLPTATFCGDCGASLLADPAPARWHQARQRFSRSSRAGVRRSSRERLRQDRLQLVAQCAVSSSAAIRLASSSSGSL